MLIVVYGYEYCPYTRNAALLAGAPITPASDLTGCAEGSRLWPLLEEVRAANHTTVPMCFDMHKKGRKFVGGYDSLLRYVKAAERAKGGPRGKPGPQTKAKPARLRPAKKSQGH